MSQKEVLIKSSYFFPVIIARIFSARCFSTTTPALPYCLPSIAVPEDRGNRTTITPHFVKDTNTISAPKIKLT